MTCSPPDHDLPRAAPALHRASLEPRRWAPGLLRSTRSTCRRARGLARSKVLGLLFGCLGLLSGGAVYADSADLDAVLHSLAARRHGEVSFIEQHFLSMLKRPVESSGELIYDAPDHLEKRTLEPRPESLVLQGRILTAQRGRSTHVLDLKSYPEVWPLIESIRATLAGDRTALEQRFNVEFGGDQGRWVLVLTPRDAEVAKAISRVQIDGAGDDLTRVEIRQPDGDRSLMTLRPRLRP